MSTNVTLIDSFDPCTSAQSFKPPAATVTTRSNRTYRSFFFCLNESCANTFECEEDLHMHILLNQHTTKESCLRSKNEAKLALFEKVKNDYASSSTFQPPTTAIVPNRIPCHFQIFTTSGCALRTRKPWKQIDKTVKAFVKSIFEVEKVYGEIYQITSLIRTVEITRATISREKNTYRREHGADSNGSQF